MKKMLLLSLLMLTSSNFAFCQIDTVRNGVYDWKKVKVFEDYEYDSIRHMQKVCVVQYQLDARFKKIDDLKLRGTNLLKQLSSIYNGSAAILVNDEINTRITAYMWLEPNPPSYSIIATIYRHKTAPKISDIPSAFLETKKYRVIERQTLNVSTMGSFKADSSIKIPIKVSSWNTDESGNVYITANMPEELDYEYNVIGLQRNNITIIARRKFNGVTSRAFIITPWD